MSFDVNWDIDKHKEEHECDDHWQLRRNFMECWKQIYPEERLVCLARVFANIEFMGCRYPQEVMQEVARMSKEVNKHISYTKYGANLPDSSVHMQTLAQGYTTAEYVPMHRNDEETTHVKSVSISKPVYPNSCDVSHTNQGYEDMCSPYSTEAMQALVRIPEGLRPPNCNSFIYGDISNQNANHNSTEITKPSNLQFINSVSENCYQNKNSANHLLSWQRRDPRIQASAISQQDGIQSTNLQTNQGLSTDGTYNQYDEPITHSTSVNAQSSNGKMPPGLHVLPTQEQTVRINCYNIPDEPNQSWESLELGNMAAASCSKQLITLPQQKTYGNLEPSPQQRNNVPFENNCNKIPDEQNQARDSLELGNMAAASCSKQFITLPQRKIYGNLQPSPPQRNNVPFGNNYDAEVHSTYPNDDPQIKVPKQNRRDKKNVVVNGVVLKSAKARRYFYWLHAGKTESEAEYLCQIRLKDIPEYKALKAEIGGVCQLKRLRGNTMPTFKNKPKLKLPVKSKKSKAATNTVKESCVKGSENCEATISIPTELKTYGKRVKKRYKFWKRMGKKEKEALILCKQPFTEIPLAQEFMAEALKQLGHINNWMNWTIEQRNKSLEAKSINTRQHQEKAELETTEDPDIIEITTKEPEIVVISDDDENDKDANKIRKISKKMKIEKESQIKRFNWWIHQGKSEEEATVLSQKPMVISDALNHISDCKSNKELEENQALNVRENQSRKDHPQIRDQITPSERPNSNDLKEKWLAFKAKEDQRTSTLDKKHLQIANSCINATDENYQYKIYITDDYRKIGPEESLMIRDAIAQCISDYDDISMPSCEVLKDVFVAICTDEKSRDLLDKQIPTLEPWKGARLNIVNGPPNIDAFMSTSLITKEVSTIMPQAEVVESPYNMAEETTVSMALRSINCDEGNFIEISNDMIPTLVAPEQASPSNSLAIKQKNEQAALNYKNVAQNHAQSTSAEQASHSTHHTSSIMANELNQRKVRKSADSWGIDTPRLLSGHKNAITLKTDPQVCSDRTDSDDARLKAHFYREVKPFSGQDEKYSVEERVAARILNDGPTVFKEQDRAIQDFTHDEQVLAEQRLREEYSVENRFSDRQSPENYGEGRFDERDSEFSRSDRVFGRRLQECSREVIDEGEGTTSWKDRFIQDTPKDERDFTGQSQEYFKEDRGFAGRSSDYSETRFYDTRIPENYEGRFNERNAESSRNYSILGKRDREYFEEERVFDEQEKIDPSEDIDSHDYPQEERVLAGQSHEYLGKNRFFDRISPKNSVDRRFDERDAKYSRNYRDFIGRRHENTRDIIYQREDRISLKTKSFQDEEREKYFTKNREFNGASRHSEDSGEGRFDEQDEEYSRNNRVFDERDQEYSQERGSAGRFQGYPREDSVFDSHKNKYFNERDFYRKDRNVEVNERYPREHRDARDQNYSSDDRDRQTRERFHASNRPYTLDKSKRTMNLQLAYPNEISKRPKKKRSSKKY